jgi:hypothetical protein
MAEFPAANFIHSGAKKQCHTSRKAWRIPHLLHGAFMLLHGKIHQVIQTELLGNNEHLDINNQRLFIWKWTARLLLWVLNRVRRQDCFKLVIVVALVDEAQHLLNDLGLVLGKVNHARGWQPISS